VVNPVARRNLRNKLWNQSARLPTCVSPSAFTVILDAAIIWIVLALVETGHGILRLRLLNPRLGAHRANQVGVVVGSALVFLVGWFAVPWIGPASTGACLGVGAIWLVLMLAFEFGLGHWVFRRPWARLAAEFDLRQGGLLGFGMALLFLTPLLVTRLRG